MTYNILRDYILTYFIFITSNFKFRHRQESEIQDIIFLDKSQIQFDNYKLAVASAKGGTRMVFGEWY